MVWWIRTRERADAEGRPLGLYHLTAYSDEDGGGPFGLCSHDHATAAEADNCPEARTNADRV